MKVLKSTDVMPADSTVDRSEFPTPIMDLTDRGQKFYDLLIDHLNDAKVLYKADAIMISVLAKDLDLLVGIGNDIEGTDDVVQTYDNGTSNVSGHFTAYNKILSQVNTISTKLGLSPADREKMMSFANVRNSGTKDPYSQLRNQKTAGK